MRISVDSEEFEAIKKGCEFMNFEIGNVVDQANGFFTLDITGEEASIFALGKFLGIVKCTNDAVSVDSLIEVLTK